MGSSLSFAARWVALRMIVTALAVATVLALGNLTVQLLVLAYANITPYAGP